MRFGYHNASFEYPGDENPLEATIEAAKRYEAAGFELFTCMDHLWQLPFVGERTDPFFDVYTVLPAVARETEEIELSALVTSPHYRNPAMLGRILTTLDHVSGGRAVLGIGAGWFEEEYRAYGFEFPDASTRVRQLVDTVRLVRAMWTEDSPVTYRGEHHEIEDLYLEPKPIQDPPDVMIGGGGEQLTLKAVAEEADRWNVPGVSPETFAHKMDVLDDHCETFGTDFDAIEKTVFQTAVIRDTSEAAHEAYERHMRETAAGDPAPRDEFRGLVGTPAEVASLIEAFADRGAEMLMVRGQANDPETVDYLAEELVPDLRD